MLSSTREAHASSGYGFKEAKTIFLSAQIAVVTKKFPLKVVLSLHDIFGRLAKCTIKLGEYGLSFEPHKAIKSQGLVDFIADFSINQQIAAEKEVFETSNGSSQFWTLLIDGFSNSKGSGLGIVLISPQQTQIKRAIRSGLKAANNEAEYEALLAEHTLANELRIRNLILKSNFQLIIN